MIHFHDIELCYNSFRDIHINIMRQDKTFKQKHAF